MTLANIAKTSQEKGLKLVATADFTHPSWFKEISRQLVPAESGLYRLKDSESQIRFIAGTEVSLIYSQNQRLRKIHHLIYLPSLEKVAEFNDQLAKLGNLETDGRPIISIDSRQLLELLLTTSSEGILIPAHAWTPWFGIFGSKSGFDSIEECFGPDAKNIFAVETGLSSDIEMNRLISKLDKIKLVSFSDAHSLAKLAREATIFSCPLTYQGIRQALSGQRPGQIEQTIEFFPEEGKYHYDGHRSCQVSLAPEQSRKLKNICPVCGRPLTIGVLNRVQSLADRSAVEQVERSTHLIPLRQIISDVLAVGEGSQKVQQAYRHIIDEGGSELTILLEMPETKLASLAGEAIARAIIRMRQGQVEIKPGFDGVYGQVKIKDKMVNSQASLL